MQSKIRLIRPIRREIPPIYARFANVVTNEVNSACSGFDFDDVGEMWRTEFQIRLIQPIRGQFGSDLVKED